MLQAIVSAALGSTGHEEGPLSPPVTSSYLNSYLHLADSMSLETPVAFFVFNRPDVTQRVFAQIAKARPRKLLVVCDGPRAHLAAEVEQVAAVRTIIDQVDWSCDVLRNYSDTNLGCKQRIATGLEWVFSKFEEAIILEDDCLPDSSFFRFANSCYGNTATTIEWQRSAATIFTAKTSARKTATTSLSIFTAGGGLRGGVPGATST